MATQDEWAPAPSSAAAPRATGAMTLEGYSELTEVARGGDSIVYRARQSRLDRDVAIKVVDITDPTAKARFARELEITVRLGRQHPHIVSVLDTTTTADGRPCLVMEFHDLGSLHDRLRAHGPLPVSEVVAAGTAVADALAFAHAHGVLHRDVKPQNVLLLPTSYVLSDFGIARMADAGHTASLERFSYRHASPQVLDGAEPTEADDVWSLGSSLFTLLDGRAPFASDDPDDDSALAYLRRVRMNQRRPLREDLPAQLRGVVDACLTPRREDRTWSATDVLAALRTVPTEQRSWAPASGGVPPASGGAPDVAEPLPTAASPRAVASPAAAAAAVSAGSTAPGTAAASTPDDPADDVTGPPPPEMFDAWQEQPADPAQEAGPARGTGSVAAGPVAPSALASIVETRPVDAEHTSARPEPQPTGPEEAGSADEPEVRGNPWTKIAAFIGGALVVGTGFGVLSALLGNDDEPDPTPTAIDAAEVPTMTDPVPTMTGPIQASTGDPDLAPRNPAVLDNGTSVLLTWAPPVADVDHILVLDPGEDEVIRYVAGTAEEYTVEGVDPNASEVCFAVAGYAMDEGRLTSGASPAVCITRP
ncbi:protein kinase domain-containing protein [Georgenia sunbinii]|uniref:protein kinase domain-containing protein n=1 Tax=Georgenia sunbinii TaxID=3117728 RepID=UPI002F263F98